MDQPGKVANPARDELNRNSSFFLLFPFAPEHLISRDRFDNPIPASQPAHSPHTRTEYVSHLLTGFLPLPRRRSFSCTVSPEFIKSCNFVPMAFTDDRPPAQISIIRSSTQGRSSNGCYRFRYHHISTFVRLSFQHFVTVCATEIVGGG